MCEKKALNGAMTTILACNRETVLTYESESQSVKAVCPHFSQTINITDEPLSASFHPTYSAVVLVSTADGGISLYQLPLITTGSNSSVANPVLCIIGLDKLSVGPADKVYWTRLNDDSFFSLHYRAGIVVIWNLLFLRQKADRSTTLQATPKLLASCARQFRIWDPTIPHHEFLCVNSADDTSKKLTFLVKFRNQLLLVDSFKRGRVVAQISLPNDDDEDSNSCSVEDCSSNHNNKIDDEEDEDLLLVGSSSSSSSNTTSTGGGGITTSSNNSTSTTTNINVAPITTTTTNNNNNITANADDNNTQLHFYLEPDERSPHGSRPSSLKSEATRTVATTATSGNNNLHRLEVVEVTSTKGDMTHPEKKFLAVMHGTTLSLIDIDWNKQTLGEQRNPIVFQLEQLKPTDGSPSILPIPNSIIKAILTSNGPVLLWLLITATSTFILQIGIATMGCDTKLVVALRDSRRRRCQSATLLTPSKLALISYGGTVDYLDLSQLPKTLYTIQEHSKKPDHKLLQQEQLLQQDIYTNLLSTVLTSNPSWAKTIIADTLAENSSAAAKSFSPCMLEIDQSGSISEATANQQLWRRVNKELIRITSVLEQLASTVCDVQTKLNALLSYNNSYSTSVVLPNNNNNAAPFFSALLSPQRAAAESEFLTRLTQARAGAVGWDAPWASALAHDCLAETPAIERRALRSLCSELRTPGAMGSDIERLSALQLLSSAGVLAASFLEHPDWRPDEVDIIANWIYELVTLSSHYNNSRVYEEPVDEVPLSTRLVLNETLKECQQWARTNGFEVARQRLEIASSLIEVCM